ncbi:MAG TPA: zinc-dependent alcohol dehydrogenase family protein [Thermoplasmata archaeon]|nr:zinc-dependent alcohol dehydrogenase family protein [Thermoplasmata archaeon]
MELVRPKDGLIEVTDRPRSDPGPHEVTLRVEACGVCRTDLHVVDGELPDPRLPLVPGHEIVGVVREVGVQVTDYRSGDRIGVPWLAWTCGECEYCRSGRENLCDRARFTGYTVDGGYADFARADARYVLRMPTAGSPVEVAPLLCSGLVGYRALRLAGEGPALGMYGFGGSAHLVAQVAIHRGQQVYAFTRPGDLAGQEFARELGATWAGGSDERPPRPLDAAIVFAPVGSLVPLALAATRKGGSVVCAGIHMSDIPSFPYSLLWGERVVRSVANLTRDDGREFLRLAAEIPVRTTTTAFPLARANEALAALREGRIRGSAVLVP